MNPEVEHALNMVGAGLYVSGLAGIALVALVFWVLYHPPFR